jgi:hypothetical protein
MRDFDQKLSTYANDLCTVIPDPTDLSDVESRLGSLETLVAALTARVVVVEAKVSLVVSGNLTWIVVSTTPYIVTGHKIGLLVTTATLAITITLPKASGYNGETIYIKDNSGNAGANNITVTPYGTDTIDDDATLVIDSDYAGVQLKSNGTGWEIV